MKYVLDSCVAFKWLVPEDLEAEALRLRDGYAHGVHELLAPDVFPTEVAHALTRAERQQRISVSEAAMLWQDLMTTAPQLLPSLPLTPRAIDISSHVRLGVYDCLYVALAEREQCELVTSDEKLLKKLQKKFPIIVPLAAVP